MFPTPSTSNGTLSSIQNSSRELRVTHLTIENLMIFFAFRSGGQIVRVDIDTEMRLSKTFLIDLKVRVSAIRSEFCPSLIQLAGISFK